MRVGEDKPFCKCIPLLDFELTNCQNNLLPINT